MKNVIIKAFHLLIVTSLFIAFGTTCFRGADKNHNQSEPVISMEKITKVMNKHTDELMSVDGVVGVYIGQTDSEELCIKVMVVEISDTLLTKFPKTLDGIKVEIEETGVIRPM